jgi:Pyridoxamine 5'-phosphate oxidase
MVGGWVVPEAGRPFMPGYGLPPGDNTAGLLPWSWAQEHLEASHIYWLATTRPDGRPHVMPVWGIWADQSFAFSTGSRSLKARNLAASPWCVVTSEDTAEAVIVEGATTMVDNPLAIARLSEVYAAKYGAAPPDPAEGPIFVLIPAVAFGFVERAEDFIKTATRWTFDPVHRGVAFEP